MKKAIKKTIENARDKWIEIDPKQRNDIHEVYKNRLKKVISIFLIDFGDDCHDFPLNDTDAVIKYISDWVEDHCKMAKDE